MEPTNKYHQPYLITEPKRRREPDGDSKKLQRTAKRIRRAVSEPLLQFRKRLRDEPRINTRETKRQFASTAVLPLLNDDCYQYLLTFFDLPDLYSCIQLNKNGIFFVYDAILSLAKRIFGNKLALLATRPNLSESEQCEIAQKNFNVAKEELVGLRQELKQLAETKLSQLNPTDEKNIKEAVREYQMVRTCIANLSKLPISMVLTLFSSKEFHVNFPKVLNALALAKLREDYQAFLNNNDVNINKILVYAIHYDQSNVIRFLLKCGVNPHSKLLEKSLLWHAVAHGKFEISILLLIECIKLDNNYIQNLIDDFTNSHSVNDNDKPILKIAFRTGNLPIIKFLKKQGMKFSIKDREGFTPLFYVTISNNLNAVKFLIAQGTSVHDKTKTGKTLLHLAARHASPDMLSYLLDEGLSLEDQEERGLTPVFFSLQKPQNFFFFVNKTNLRHKSKSGKTLLHLAAGEAPEEILTWLIREVFFSLEAEDTRGLTPIFYALKNPKNFRFLVENKANIYHITQTGATLLHHAASEAPEEILQWILEKNFSLEAENDQGLTPIFYALQNDKNFYFLADQVNLHHKTKDNATLMHFAACSASKETLIVLSNAGFSLEDETSQGTTPIFYALNNPENLGLLLQLGANLFHKTKPGDTLLHIAARLNRLGTCIYLHQKGLSLESENNQGFTPLFSALASPRILRFLLKEGANINHTTREGATLLHIAARKAPIQILAGLLEEGLSLEAIDNKGQTPIFYALENSVNFKFLLGKGANIRHKTSTGKTIFDLAKELNDPLINELLENTK